MKLINVEIDGVMSGRYLQMQDVRVVHAEYEDGTPLTAQQLLELDTDREEVLNAVLDKIVVEGGL